MTFLNNKKTYLAKLDKSKKGEIDKKVVSLIKIINSKKEYFTTSSCSGRVILWQGESGKKNENKWLKVSHGQISLDFFKGLEREKELVWLRLEPFILHVCCQDMEAANNLLNQAKIVFKKSSILTASNKIIVEVKGSDFVELPLVKEQEFLFKEERLGFLVDFLNEKLKQIHQRIDLFEKKIIEEKIKNLNQCNLGSYN